jgi:Polysaccharide lyase
VLGGSQLIVLRLWLFLSVIGAAVVPALAQGPQPIFRSDFGTSCVIGSSDWKISTGLDKAVRSERLRCAASANPGERHRTLLVTIRPGDAYEPEPTSTSTERVEIQVRRELIRFDTTTWYSFMLRVHSPWLPRENRTVIQQIKQSIDKRYEIGRGSEETCTPAHPLFKIEVGSNDSSPVFRAKTTGTTACGPDVGKKLICGDWPLSADTWHRVHVAIRPSQSATGSNLQVWLDGRACPVFRGILGYARYGVQHEGHPFIDTQPRFGIYRDALELSQTIEFDDIAFWDTKPTGHPVWVDIDLEETN